MNLALPALLVFLGLFPGICFSAALWKGYRDLSFEQRHLPKTLVHVVLASGLLHAFWGLVSAAIGLTPRIDVYLTLLLQDSPERTTAAVNAVSGSIGWILLYFTTLAIVSWLVGVTLNYALWRARLDLRKPTSWMFASTNPWYYILKGEYVLLPEVAAAEAPPDLVLIAATVTMGSQTHLYYGRFERAYFDSSSDLDRIVLADVSRRTLADDRRREDDHEFGGGSERYYTIEGDYLVLRYEDISSLNVEYGWLEPVKDEASAADAAS